MTNVDRGPIFTQKPSEGIQIRNVILDVTATKFTKFLQKIAVSSPVLTPSCRWWYCIPFRNGRAKTEGGQFQRLQKVPKLIGYQCPLSNLKTNVRLIILTHVSKLKIWSTSVEHLLDNQQDMSIFAFFSHKYKNKQTFLWSYCTKPHHFVHDVATFKALLSCRSAFLYSNPFQNGRRQ